MLDTLSPPYSVPPSLPPSTRRHKLDDLSLQPEDPSLQLLTGFNSSLSLDDGGDYKPAIYHGGQSESVLAGYRSPLKAESGLGAYGSPTIEHSSQYAPSKLRHTTTFNPLTAVWHLSHFLIFLRVCRTLFCLHLHMLPHFFYRIHATVDATTSPAKTPESVISYMHSGISLFVLRGASPACCCNPTKFTHCYCVPPQTTATV